MGKYSVFEEVAHVCDSLTPEQDALTREIVTRVADKWSLWALVVIQVNGAPLRFSRILEQVEGVSQKSLTKTLRQLQRDGLITRKVFAEVPPRVEYTITRLGTDMLRHVEPLWLWVARTVDKFQSARDAFDHSVNSAKSSGE